MITITIMHNCLYVSNVQKALLVKNVRTVNVIRRDVEVTGARSSLGQETHFSPVGVVQWLS